LQPSPAEAYFAVMPSPLEEELAGVIQALMDNFEAMRLEAWRILNESQNWTEEEYRAFRGRFNASSEDFLRLVERKRHLEREIRSSR
jgi:hypothetical protein